MTFPVETAISHATYSPIRAPRGTSLSCKGWEQEAAMRMLMNNLDEEVAERPQDLVVYGGPGKAARNWDCYRRDRRVAEDAGRTTRRCWCSRASRWVCSRRTSTRRACLIANSNLVGHWSNWEKFNELERAGLMMYGQMTAGSWIYIGSQGIVQGTFETFRGGGRETFWRRSCGQADCRRAAWVAWVERSRWRPP